jgi:uncharacterized protein YhaN
MSDALPDETRLAAEIDRLKAEFPKTRELYREVCALLFFRFGITPTANRLYQLVKRGSMSTPTQVLGEFWTELREKSRVRIDHPDLPADLRGVAGELIATLWTRATASAQAELDALRVDVEAQRTEAGQRVAAARGELDRTETALEQRTAALLAAQVEVRELEKAQAEGHAARQALETGIGRLRDEALARERELTTVREGFSRDLGTLRESAERAEERLRASEKRALLEIDRERSAATKLQKERDDAVKRADHREADHRRVIEALQAQLGDARHQAGVLQGRLDAVQATYVALQAQLAASREADTSPARPARAKATHPARPAVKRPSRTAPAAGSKTAVRRKRG